MSRKIRFALDMKDNVEVRTLDELRENFSLEKILLHIASGKLVTWLRDRYYDDIADKIEALDTSDSNYNKKICEIFDVAYDDTSDADFEKAEEHNRKLNLLKTVSDTQEYIDNVDRMAFEQDDIYDLLDDGETVIYLCGEQFSIPLSKNGITYIGVNNPIVVIDSKEIVDWEAKRISLKNIRYDEKYSSLETNVCKESIVPNLSIEINDCNVRLVKWSEVDGKVTIEKFAERLLAKGSVIDGRICKSLGVEGALKDIIEVENIIDTNVSLCIDSNEIIYKKLTIQDSSETITENEIKNGICGSLVKDKDYSILYKIISREKDEYYRSICNCLVTAVPTDIIDSYKEIFRKIGLNIIRCFCSYDCINSLLSNEEWYKESAPILFIDLENDIRISVLPDMYYYNHYPQLKNHENNAQNKRLCFV